MTGAARTRRLCGELLLTVVVIAACGADDGASFDGGRPTAAESARVSIRAEPDTVRPGEVFHVTISSNLADGRRVVAPVALSLRNRSGDEVALLIVRGVLAGSDEKTSLPPGTPIPEMALPGAGPFEFQMATVDPGRYEVCSDLVLATGGEAEPEQRLACDVITIRRR